jgi:tight adherence protein C
MTFFLILGLAAAGVSVAFVLRTFAVGRQQSQRTFAQIGAYGFNPVNTGEQRPHKLGRSLGQIATAVGTLLERRGGPTRAKTLRSQLNAAGLYGTSVAKFLGYRLLTATVAGLVVLWFTIVGGAGPRAIATAASLAFLGWFMPGFLLKRRIRLRLEAIDHEVPELVDLLVTTVEAGVGFASALQLSARRIEGPLGDELRLVLREQSVGLTIEEALRNLLSRVDSPTLRAFVQAILQGETLGVSIGKILRDLAVDMRKRRRQDAEERAQKAPTKILFPLVTLIFPALLIVTVGPAVIAIIHGLAGA